MVTTLMGALLTNEGFEVQTCADAASARTCLTSFDPDLAILDVNLGSGPSGLHLGHVISRLHPEVALLYLTRYPTAIVTGSVTAGHIRESRILPKDEVQEPSVLLGAIEDALGGRASELPAADRDLSRLTRGQFEVLGLVAEGLTNTAIAEVRSTSERAVEKQLRRIYETLGLTAGKDQNARVLAAMKYARSLGWADLPRGSSAHDIGLWSEAVVDQRAALLHDQITRWNDLQPHLLAPLRALAQVIDESEIDPRHLETLLSPFASPDKSMMEALDLLLASTWSPRLAEAVERGLGGELDSWLTSFTGGPPLVDRTRRCFVIGVALGLVTESWRRGGAAVDVGAELPALAGALANPGKPATLPADRAVHLDALPCVDTDDPVLDAVFEATFACVGALSLEASTSEVIAAAAGVRQEDVLAHHKGVPELFLAASDAMLGQALILNDQYQQGIADEHSDVLAEACLLREFMHPDRVRLRGITVEQLRLGATEATMQRAFQAALATKEAEIRRQEPGECPEAIRARLTFELALTSGLIIIAQIRPETWRLPFDIVLGPWRERQNLAREVTEDSSS